MKTPQSIFLLSALTLLVFGATACDSDELIVVDSQKGSRSVTPRIVGSYSSSPDTLRGTRTHYFYDVNETGVILTEMEIVLRSQIEISQKDDSVFVSISMPMEYQGLSWHFYGPDIGPYESHTATNNIQEEDRNWSGFLDTSGSTFAVRNVNYSEPIVVRYSNRQISMELNPEFEFVLENFSNNMRAGTEFIFLTHSPFSKRFSGKVTLSAFRN
ncbi:MAG: hypothetical protein BMS9Abin05_0736 [Rhodothermia bacterium]|nr:MAG: hypothetical protein BMS9Abin05_0736 [Rhodothermia bacterium]